MKTAYPPGPKGLPLLGSLLDLRKDKLGFLTSLAKTYGDFVHFRVGPRNAYLVSRPDCVHDILVEHPKRMPKEWIHQRIVAPFFGNGVVTSNGAVHARQRKLAQPAFQPRRLDNYCRIFVEQTLLGIEEWRSGGEYDIDNEMLRMTIQNVSLTLFSADAMDIVPRAAAAMTDILGLLGREYDVALPIPMWVPSEYNRRKKAAIRELNDIVMKFVEDWRKTGQDKGDLLSMLMLAHGEGGDVTHDDLRDNMIAMFSAGHETTAFTLVWTWIMLARYPEVEAALWEELDRVLGGRPPTAEDYPKLVYTQMIIKETLRIYPTGWLLFPRETTEDVALGEYTIPKGGMIYVSPYVIHRNPAYFPDPERFDPERFRAGADKQLPRGAYIPFGLGPRVCMGQHFATMEAVLILATVAQRYRVSILAKQPLVPSGSLALRPPRGVKVRVTARQPASAAAA
ncbi:cytochrome P450 [Polyangium sp. 6x1]|uniref:cytochrome P450 n=1 Tax=Polyangium sp. 6x1 TaxID=3042689 RepID=UPI00248286EB|nr:cytochrome P450 [Polyangium sp. 6x1]MDI1442687.1 cytochrome P450 [Polyangium sp. 6x1]